jgi:hypothetical protein
VTFTLESPKPSTGSLKSAVTVIGPAFVVVGLSVRSASDGRTWSMV